MKQPKIGLALGAGGARGFAHIGVLEALLRHGISIDALAGSSMGSVVAALFAAGVDVRTMASLATNLRRRHFFDFTVPKMGFVAGDRIQNLLRLLTRDLHFHQLDVPIAVVATDLRSGERVVFRDGPVHEAVRASISIPGIFVPFKREGRLYVDGGVIDRVPVHAVRDLEVDILVAVDVGMHDQLPPVRSIFDVILQSIDIMDRELAITRAAQADLVIRPMVGHISSSTFTNIEECIEAGRQAGMAALDEIRVIIRAWQRSDDFEQFGTAAK